MTVVVSRDLQKSIARSLASALWDDGKSGKISTIGIDAIRAKIASHGVASRMSQADRYRLEELICRDIVGRVG